VKTILPPPESQVRELCYAPEWHLSQDVKFLCWLARVRVPASLGILEIGCDRGQLTRELAVACPFRTIYAQDYALPYRGEVGQIAVHLPNVVVLTSPSLMLRYDHLNLGLIFLDGDRSTPGVVADTIKAWGYFRDTSNPGFIVWHDAQPGSESGVRPYLENRIDPFHEVTFVNGTWLALAGFNGAAL